MEQVIGRVAIGMDPHKASATIEVLDSTEQVVLTGRFGTDRAGYRSMLALGRRWPDRVWAIEGCQGIGRHVAQCLVADGAQVGGRAGQAVRASSGVLHRAGPKTDATNAHSIATVAVRTPTLLPVAADETVTVLRLLSDRRDELAHTRTQVVSRLHRLLLELVPGGAKTFLSATQAKALIASVRPRDVAARPAARWRSSCSRRSWCSTASSNAANSCSVRPWPRPAVA